VRSLSTLFRVSLLCLGFASAAHAGGLSLPFTDETICGNIAVAPTLTAAGNYVGAGAQCPAICRGVSAHCHGLVVRVASCDTAFTLDNAAIEIRSCNMLGDPVSRIACRASVKASVVAARSAIVSERDASFTSCDSWEADCMAACP
jgi:hypothetical protein